MNESAREPFEIHRRIGLLLTLAVLALAVAGGLGWFAYDRREVGPAVLAGVLVLLALPLLRGCLDPRTPLFVADDHGVRLQSDDGWIGLLWSEMGDVRVERRDGLRHGARVKVISIDGRRMHATPLGVATTVTPERAESELARRRGPAAY